MPGSDLEVTTGTALPETFVRFRQVAQEQRRESEAAARKQGLVHDRACLEVIGALQSLIEAEICTEGYVPLDIWVREMEFAVTMIIVGFGWSETEIQQVADVVLVVGDSYLLGNLRHPDSFAKAEDLESLLDVLFRDIAFLGTKVMPPLPEWLGNFGIDEIVTEESRDDLEDLDGSDPLLDSPSADTSIQKSPPRSCFYEYRRIQLDIPQTLPEVNSALAYLVQRYPQHAWVYSCIPVDSTFVVDPKDPKLTRTTYDIVSVAVDMDSTDIEKALMTLQASNLPIAGTEVLASEAFVTNENTQDVLNRILANIHSK
jgi:hypothetical protein